LRGIVLIMTGLRMRAGAAFPHSVAQPGPALSPLGRIRAQAISPLKAIRPSSPEKSFPPSKRLPLESSVDMA
jgi:hypothetical protein